MGTEYGVAPCVGAWIETSHVYHGRYTALSLPAWERGLKPIHETEKITELMKSLPAWERGLKHVKQ